MNSVLAAGLISLLFLVTVAIWILKLRINPLSVRFLAALICTFGQVIFEVSLTFPASPLELSDIPTLHFIVLAGIALSSSNSRRSIKSISLVKFQSFRQFTRTDLLKCKDLIVCIPFMTMAIIIGMFVSFSNLKFSFAGESSKHGTHYSRPSSELREILSISP